MKYEVWSQAVELFQQAVKTPFNLPQVDSGILGKSLWDTYSEHVDPEFYLFGGFFFGQTLFFLGMIEGSPFKTHIVLS